MFHDDKMDISAYILIRLIGTACAWKEDTIQLLTSISVDIRIYLPEKVIIHRGR